MFFAYFAPEVTFPVASALAATVGFLVLVGRAPLRMAGGSLRLATRPFRSIVRGVRSVAEKWDL